LRFQLLGAKQNSTLRVPGPGFIPARRRDLKALAR
jgi:hypothetical protein